MRGIHQSYWVRPSLTAQMCDDRLFLSLSFLHTPSHSLAESWLEMTLQIGSKFSKGWVGLVVEGLNQEWEGVGVDKEEQRVCEIEKW